VEQREEGIFVKLNTSEPAIESDRCAPIRTPRRAPALLHPCFNVVRCEKEEELERGGSERMVEERRLE
jgi:hypothetical protein